MVQANLSNFLMSSWQIRRLVLHKRFFYAICGFCAVCVVSSNFYLSTLSTNHSFGEEQECIASEPKKLKTVGKSVLITGAAGFIGMHTALELKKRGFHVVGVDNLNAYYSPRLKVDRVALLKDAKVEFVRGDICDEQLLTRTIQAHKIERVIHLAAQAGVRYSLESPHSYTKNNVDCFVSVMETFVKTGLHANPIVYASSSSVYGLNNVPPFSEATSDVDHPASLYAATKRSDELIAHTYNHLYNVSSVGLRFFTVYGPYGRPDMSPMIFATKIIKNETLLLSNFGNSVRDFTYVSDVVNGVIASLEFQVNKAEIINIGNGNPIKLTRFVELMEQGLGKKAVTDLVLMQKGDVPMTSADIRKAKCSLGWTPRVSIEDGMPLFLDWFNAHDASRYMPAPKKEVCFINSSFSKISTNMDQVMDVSHINKDQFAFYFFSNLDVDHSEKGWENIKLDLPYRRIITMSRWPKFMAWKHAKVKANCKTVFYFDASSRPCKNSSWLEDILELVPKLLSSEEGLSIPTHPSSKAISIEFKEILRISKDLQMNVEASLAWMKDQEDFQDKVQIYQLTYFMYDPSSSKFRDATEFFWDRYSKELDSWRDQPLMAYTLHHFNIKPLYMAKFLGCHGGIGHGGHKYTVKDN